MGIVKLMYHHIADDIEDRMVIDTNTFQSQIELIKNLKIPVLLTKDILNGVQDGVMLTFDDGYKSTFEIALPILKDNEMNAMMAVCGDYFTNQESLDIATIHVSQEFCDVSELKQWIKEGNEITAHTLSHPKLTAIPLEEAKNEILKSKYKIKQILNYNPIAFTYPFGSTNTKIKKIVSKEFKAAYATTEGNNDDIFNLKRIEINSQLSLSSFKKIIEDKIEEM